MFQGSLSCPVYTWGTPGLHVWISSADRKPKPFPHPPSSGTVTLSQTFYPMVPKSFFRTVRESRLRAEVHQEFTLRLKATVHSSWPSCKFSLAKNMHFLLSLMSKGTWMVRTSVWMLQSRPLNVWCRAVWCGTQRSELTQPSPVAHTPICGGPSSEKQWERQEASLFQKWAFSEDVSCSLDLSQIQFLQLLIGHKELQVY